MKSRQDPRERPLLLRAHLQDPAVDICGIDMGDFAGVPGKSDAMRNKKPCPIFVLCRPPVVHNQRGRLVCLSAQLRRLRQPKRPPPHATPKAAPVVVYLGTYSNRIPALSFRDNQWTVDAYVWFRWKGNLVPPPQDTFALCNGTIGRERLPITRRFG